MEIIDGTLILENIDIRRGRGVHINGHIEINDFNVDMKDVRMADHVVYISREGFIRVIKSRTNNFLTALSKN